MTAGRLKRWVGSLRGRLTSRLIWDLVMVYLAFLNLGLILFDLTYLRLRPVYFRYLPAVTRIYDPVKGVEPHPQTVRYLEAVESVAARHSAGAGAQDLQPQLEELQALSRELFERNPFERSGQNRSLIRLEKEAERHLTAERGAAGARTDDDPALVEVWSVPPGPLEDRLAFFEEELRPLLAVNFHRAYDLDGNLVDHFWLIDLPFLAIFAIEFFGRWFLAVRRRKYPRWFLFPLFHWYDLLGIIPVRELRIFRLFRIASIYVRLHRSEHTGVGDEFVSRTVRYFANIISEEISDMVALRILNETQEEIRDGTHRRIIRSVVEQHRDSLVEELTVRFADILQSESLRLQADDFLDMYLERAVESSRALRRLPLPDTVLRPLVNSVGQAIYNSLLDTLGATLASDEGRAALQEIISDSVDSMVEEATSGEIDELVQDISLQVIDQMKEAISVRKWALPDAPPRSVFTASPRE